MLKNKKSKKWYLEYIQSKFSILNWKGKNINETNFTYM